MFLAYISAISFDCNVSFCHAELIFLPCAYETVIQNAKFAKLFVILTTNLIFIMKKILFALLFITLFNVASVFGQVLDYDKLAPHPRLLLKSGDITMMKEFAATVPNGKKVHNMIIAEADDILNLETAKREMQGMRLLAVSRMVLKRVFYLSYAYLMTDDVRYAARAEREMLAVCEFTDWNPSHFLDTAELTMALAIGYDWLYRYLPVHSRSIIGTTIYEKGLHASENADFFSRNNNWNQVCNAGMVYGALATLERSPEYCKSLIAKCLASNPIAQQVYDPDGAYPEGYGYWDYGTSFEVLLIAGLQSALGTDAGITAQRSFMRTAEFVNYMIAPSSNPYNYFDTSSKGSCLFSKYWFARQLNDTSLVALDEKFVAQGNVRSDGLLPTYMIYASGMDLADAKLPKGNSWSSKGEVPLYIYRSGWTKPTDTYFAIKGGRAASNHGHMDAGSFVYEYDGVRWAVDLGQHNYNNLEQAGISLWNMSQKSQRWDVFRIGAESHNTLVINSQRHNVDGRAEITSNFTTSQRKGAVIDLTPVFTPYARNVVRTAELDKKDYLKINDHIVAGDAPTTVEWKIATRAKAEIIAPQIIMLTQDGKTMYLRLNGRLSATAKIWPEHDYMDCETHDEGLSRVGFVIELRAGENVDVEVMLSPERGKSISLPKLKLNLGRRNRAK